MKRLTIAVFLCVSCASVVHAQAQKPQDKLHPQCEQKQKQAIRECKNRGLRGKTLERCLAQARYGAFETLSMSGTNKREKRYCERESTIKDKYGKKCISECPRGVAVLSRSVVEGGLKVRTCRDEKGENYVVACREEQKKDTDKEKEKDTEKEKLKKAEERALGGEKNTTTHYDCRGMGRSSTCYGADGVIKTQADRDLKRLRDGDIAIPQNLKKQYDLNFGDRVLLEHTTKNGEVRQAWATVRDMNSAPTIDFFREYDPGLGRSVRESTPMRELGFTYGTTYGDRSQVRIIQVDRSGRFYTR